jgi:hypothetical protein
MSMSLTAELCTEAERALRIGTRGAVWDPENPELKQGEKSEIGLSRTHSQEPPKR